MGRLVFWNSRSAWLSHSGRAGLLALFFVAMVAMPRAAGAAAQLTIGFTSCADGTSRLHVSSVAALSLWPPVEFSTATVWPEGRHSFKGILKCVLLTHRGIDPSAWGGAMTLHATNGYSATIGSGQVSPKAPLIALYPNGRQLPKRARGRFRVVFPYDDDPEFRRETVHALSGRQLVRVSIEP